MNTGDTATIEGLEVYLKEVYYLSKESQVSSVKLIVGSSKLTLSTNSKATIGEDTNIDGTRVSISGSSSGISKLTIGVAGGDSSSDFIAQGADNAFVDPVFRTFKVALGGMTPALDDAARETIVVDNSGTTGATVKFTDYRGNEKTLTFAQTASTGWAPWLNASSTRDYEILEGKYVNESNYVLLAPSQESEFGHIFQLTDVNDVGGNNPSFTLTDAISADTVQVFLEKGGYKEFYIDGQLYCGANASTTSMAFYWGSGVTCAKYRTVTAGLLTTVSPLIKTVNGGYITFLDNRTTLAFNTTYEFPLNAAVLIGTFEASTHSEKTVAAGQITYGFDNISATPLRLRNVTNTATMATMVSTFPAVLFVQEEDNSTTKDVITVDTAADGTNNIKIDTPKLTGISQSQALGSDTSITQYLNVFGTQAEHDTDSQGIVTIQYPDTQAIVTIGIGSNPTFNTAGGTTTETAMKITAPVAKVASDVSSTAPGADLILIGGPCANTLTATVLSGITSCDNWSYTEGIIKEVTDAFTDGSKALVVAGTTADNTRAMAAKLISGTLSYEV